MGEKFKEEMTVLDYGCGGVRYVDFISQRLKTFKYYGIEPPNGTTKATIEDLKIRCKNDSRIELGYIGEEIESKAYKESDVIVLGSIFTHLKFDKFNEICDKFVKYMKRDCSIVFSVFLSNEEHVRGKNNCYGQKDCWSQSYYIKNKIEDYATERGMSLKLKETFTSKHDKFQEVHQIFEMKFKWLVPFLY